MRMRLRWLVWWGAWLLGLWAQAQPARLHVGLSEWPPYEYSVHDAALGLDVDLARAALRAMGQETAFAFYPWKRVLSMAQRQEVDAIMSVRPTPERAQYLHFPNEHLSVSDNVLFVRKGDAAPDVPALQALAGHTVGVTAGYSYGEAFDAMLRAGVFQTDESLTEEQGLRKLLAARYAVFVCDRHAGWYLAQNLGVADQLSVLPLRVSSVKNFLAFTKNAQGRQRAAQFDKAVAGLKKTGQWQRIQDAYTRPEGR